MADIIAYASSTRPNHLWSSAQFNSALPKNRAEADIPLVAQSQLNVLIAAKDAEIAKLREALQRVADDASTAQELYDRLGPQWTSPQGNEYEDTSSFLAKCNELAELARAALKGDAA